ncbi:hypothetical protein [Brevibacillus invocatus]|uniref:hypothetical protein n=1 Tax=Brevibacillus invocatus TaxID=173959 RepID=UPI00203FD054|nr:hypothetical protein [Brevibacillus invocatus]MCM3429301.1 hypothetical protein [Brevibacillus invocatus]
MDNKWMVLIGVLLAGFFLGAETVGFMIGFPTYNVGYILAAISFLGAMILGTRRN